MFLNRIYFAPEDGTGAGEGGEGGQGDGGGGQDNKGPAGTQNAPGEGFDWPKYRESINDAGLKAYSERFNSFEDVLKTHQTQRQELSDRIRLPSDKASPEEIGKFRKALGVPEMPNGYEIKLPDGMKLSEEDAAMFEAWKPIAHANNVNAKAFNDCVVETLKQIQVGQEAFAKRLKDIQAEGEAMLKKDWSVDYDKNLALAERAAKSLGGDEFWAWLDSTMIEGRGKIAAEPAMLRLLANIGRRMDESDLMVTASTSERQTAAQALDALYQKHPIDSPGYKDKAVQAEIARLNEIVHGKKPLVGADGRAA
jgi:hypothetical protein